MPSTVNAYVQHKRNKSQTETNDEQRIMFNYKYQTVQSRVGQRFIRYFQNIQNSCLQIDTSENQIILRSAYTFCYGKSFSDCDYVSILPKLHILLKPGAFISPLLKRRFLPFLTSFQKGTIISYTLYIHPVHCL